MMKVTDLCSKKQSISLIHSSSDWAQAGERYHQTSALSERSSAPAQSRNVWACLDAPGLERKWAADYHH